MVKRMIILILMMGLTCSFGAAKIGVLSTDELNWLKAHPVIKFAPDLGYAPVEFDDQGTVKGIAIDYLKWMESNYPIKFQLVRYPTWADQINAMKNEEIDMLSGAAETPERSKYMHFTKSYITTPNVILRRVDRPAIMSEEQLLTLKVGAIDGYAVNEFVRIRFPKLNIVPVKQIKEGMLMVSNGELDAMIIESFQASYYITNLKLSNLVIDTNYPIDFPLNLSMATRKNAPELAIILDKMIDGMPAEERLSIERKWFGMSGNNGISKNILYAVFFGIAGLIMIIITVIFWNWTLRKRVAQKTTELSDLNYELEALVKKRTALLEISLNELQVSQKKLVEMEKIGALGKLVATVAHEINTPLGNCIMMASYEKEKRDSFRSVLEKQNLMDEVAKEYFESMDNAYEISNLGLSHLTTIIERFKALAVKNLDHTEDDFDLKLVFQEAMAKQDIHGRIHLDIQSDTSSVIKGVRAAYEEIFYNLINNAIMHGFSPPFEGTPKIEFRLRKQNHDLHMAFIDNGNGLSDELINRVTEPLFSTNRSGGIGFNIIMNILSDSLNGDLILDNTQKNGLKVVITVHDVIWQDDEVI